jgi:hypothetical protein
MRAAVEGSDLPLPKTLVVVGVDAPFRKCGVCHVDLYPENHVRDTNLCRACYEPIQLAVDMTPRFQ